MAERSGAVVEIIEDGKSKGALLPNRVLVNGTDVGWIEQDGIRVDPGDHENPTIVTLRLLPSRVVIRSGE